MSLRDAQGRLSFQAGIMLWVAEYYGEEVLATWLALVEEDARGTGAAAVGRGAGRVNRFVRTLSAALDCDVSPLLEYWKLPHTDDAQTYETIRARGPCAIAIDDADGDGYSRLELDPDDSNPSVYPGAPEVVDGLDNNGDGLVDEHVADESRVPGRDFAPGPESRSRPDDLNGYHPSQWDDPNRMKTTGRPYFEDIRVPALIAGKHDAWDDYDCFRWTVEGDAVDHVFVAQGLDGNDAVHYNPFSPNYLSPDPGERHPLKHLDQAAVDAVLDADSTALMRVTHAAFWCKIYAHWDAWDAWLELEVFGTMLVGEKRTKATLFSGDHLMCCSPDPDRSGWLNPGNYEIQINTNVDDEHLPPKHKLPDFDAFRPPIYMSGTADPTYDCDAEAPSFPRGSLTVDECKGLVALYKAFGGDVPYDGRFGGSRAGHPDRVNQRGWLTPGTDPCFWAGVACDSMGVGSVAVTWGDDYRTRDAMRKPRTMDWTLLPNLRVLNMVPQGLEWDQFQRVPLDAETFFTLQRLEVLQVEMDRTYCFCKGHPDFHAFLSNLKNRDGQYGTFVDPDMLACPPELCTKACGR